MTAAAATRTASCKDGELFMVQSRRGDLCGKCRSYPVGVSDADFRRIDEMDDRQKTHRQDNPDKFPQFPGFPKNSFSRARRKTPGNHLESDGFSSVGFR